jgi:hypothetical protein
MQWKAQYDKFKFHDIQNFGFVKMAINELNLHVWKVGLHRSTDNMYISSERPKDHNTFTVHEIWFSACKKNYVCMEHEGSSSVHIGLSPFLSYLYSVHILTPYFQFNIILAYASRSLK